MFRWHYIKTAGMRIFTVVTKMYSTFVLRLFYFSHKQVNHHYSLLRAYAVISGWFNICCITINRDYCTPKIKVNSPVFVYNNSHLSLNLL